MAKAMKRPAAASGFKGKVKTNSSAAKIITKKHTSNIKATMKKSALKRPGRKQPRKTRGYLKMHLADPNLLISRKIFETIDTTGRDLVRSNIVAIGGELGIFALCAGSNMSTIQAWNVCRTAKEGIVCDLGICEKNPEKMGFSEFVADYYDEERCDDRCLWEDMFGFKSHCDSVEPGKSFTFGADCSKHGRICPPPSPFLDAPPPVLATCGFVCANMSKQFNGKDGVRKEEILDGLFSHRQGESGATAGAMADILDFSRVPYLFWENSPEMLTPSNREEYGKFEAEAYGNGYANAAAVLQLSDFGPPNNRRRSCGVQVEFRDSELGYSMAKRTANLIIETVKRMKIGTIVGVGDYLFKDNDKYLQEDLENLMTTKAKGMEKGLLESDWSAKLCAFCKQHKVRASSLSLSELSSSSLTVSALPHREQKGIAAHEAVAAMGENKLVAIETSQAVSRMTTVYDDPEQELSLSTFLPRGRMIIYPPLVNGPPRAITGWESLNMMGVPWNLIYDYMNSPIGEDSEDDFLKDLAGNTFPGPILFAFIVAIFLHMPHQIKRTLGKAGTRPSSSAMMPEDVPLPEDEMERLLERFV